MNAIDQACRLLQNGKLVAFPTETVYGLGADATNPIAVQKIFTAKGRPSTNPLIVHVADTTAAKRYVRAWPDSAEKLAAHFWPGPLTLVLLKSEKIVPLVTAGRPTVGMRVPSHPMALKLLRQFDGAVAAPSANRSNHLSPTEAEHVHQELGDAVDMILDGGKCAVGIESTVLDLSGDRPTILRPGGIGREQIEKIIGSVGMFEGSVDEKIPAASPGQQEKHYSPETPMFRFEAAERERVLDEVQFRGERVVLVSRKGVDAFASFQTVAMPDEPGKFAAQLYSTLRELDEKGYSRILIEMPPETLEWVAVRDRLRRAAKPISDFV